MGVRPVVYTFPKNKFDRVTYHDAGGGPSIYLGRQHPRIIIILFIPWALYSSSNKVGCALQANCFSLLI